MKTLTALIGALALTSFGCGDDVTSYDDADADTIEETTTGFTFEGEAVYCKHVTESPVYVTCLDTKAKMRITAEHKILSAYFNILCTDHNRQDRQQDADSTEFLYEASNSMCLRDVVVNGVEIVAEDELGNQGIYSMQEDCARIQEINGGN